MSAPELVAYDLIVDNRYSLRDLIQSVTLDESLDEIAYRARVRLSVGGGFPDIRPGQPIRLSGIPYGGSAMAYLLHPAVVWSVDLLRRETSSVEITMYDRTIYLAKSEDECLFPAGQTAGQRMKKYALDWNIPLGRVPETGVILGKAVYRAQPIYRMMMSDLKETAKSGGELYRPRMTASGLELYRLGSNETVWSLDPERTVGDLEQRQTLDGAVTQVKVLGVQYDAANQLPSPVLAIEKQNTEQFGTLQRVVQDSDVKSVADARKLAREKLSGVQETFSVSGIDINTIRAGDRVELAGAGQPLIVTSVRHELGSPGRMTLELAAPEYVRRRYYYDE